MTDFLVSVSIIIAMLDAPIMICMVIILFEIMERKGVKKMTMPHLMNCSHSETGWCLDCVKRMHDEYEQKLEEKKNTIDILCRRLGD